MSIILFTVLRKHIKCTSSLSDQTIDIDLTTSTDIDIMDSIGGIDVKKTRKEGKK